MGFVETLNAIPERFRQYYLKYGHLKELVKELAKEGSQQRSRFASADLMDAGQRPVGRFQEMLQAELAKVNQFACVKHEAVFLGLRRLCDECKSLGHKIRGRPSGLSAKAALKRTYEAIENLGEEIVHLDTFVRLNYVGFQKLTQKFDRCLGVSGSAVFISALHTEAFCNVRFDDILILLGLAWARYRAAQSAEQTRQDATWKPPDSFVRNTAKYWVKPEKVVLLKTHIVKHLPYLIFGASMAEQEKLLDPFALLDLDYEGFDVQSAVGAYSGTMEESQLLSSVYFDSPDAFSYRERIQREEGARLVRFRWYGENNLEPDKEIYVERKIHHEGWGGAQSAKERCIVPQRTIFELMKGRFDIEGYFDGLATKGMYSDKARSSMKGICHEVNALIQENRLQPIIRTSYYRCAFQLATSNEVRISLDTQMSLLNEFVAGTHPAEPWCHISSDLLSKDEIYRFPFAILEIKLQNITETPSWLRQTLADIGAIQTHKFSKFQHAMAFLHPDKVPILPHWHQDFQEWHEAKHRFANYSAKRKLTVSRLLSSCDSFEENSVPHVRAVVAPQGDGHLLKDIQNLDPKGVFANERTLLHYAEKGMYVGALAVYMCNRERWGVKLLGLTLAICTFCFYCWILLEYYDRLGRIVGRAKVGRNTFLRLDSVHGPVVASALILVVLCVSFVQVVRITAGCAGESDAAGDGGA